MTQTAAQKLRKDNLVVPQGTDFRIQWPLQDKLGQPIPLDDWTARAQARNEAGSTDVLAEWTTENGAIVLADSTLTLIISSDQSSTWDWPDPVRYDVEAVSPTGQVTRITQGWLTLDPEVTRTSAP